MLGKIDWNISDKYKLSLCYLYVNGENLEVRFLDCNDICFLNGFEFFIIMINFIVLEVNFIFNVNLVNKFFIGVIFVRDDCDLLGILFLMVELFDDNIDW